jgi:hypothetical protein
LNLSIGKIMTETRSDGAARQACRTRPTTGPTAEEPESGQFVQLGDRDPIYARIHAMKYCEVIDPGLLVEILIFKSAV